MNTGDVLHTFTYEEPNTIYQEIINLPEFGCYRVTLYNEAGNGIGDGGFWGVKDKNNKTIISGTPSDNTFRYEFPFEVTYSGEGVESVKIINNVDIYPNPASDLINVTAENLTKINIYNSIGQLIYSQDVNANEVKVSTDSWTNGLYYINVETKDGFKSSQKIIVNK